MIHESPLHCPSTRPLSRSFLISVLFSYTLTSLIGPRRYAFSMMLALIQVTTTTICDHVCDIWDFMFPSGQAPRLLLHMTTSLFPCTFLIGYKR